MAGRTDNIGIASEVIFERMISLFEAGLDAAIRADRDGQVSALAAICESLHHLSGALGCLNRRDDLPPSLS